MRSAHFSDADAGIFPVVRNMPLKQYRNTVPAKVAGWVPPAAATRGILAGMILYPDSRIFS
jgi:hypothetical protein